MENYKYKKHLQPGDILFTFKKHNILSKIIWKLTRKPDEDLKVSHNVIYLGDDLIVEATHIGVMIKNVKVYSEGHYIIHTGRIKNSHTPANQKKLETVIQYGKNASGLIEYSILPIFLLMLKKVFTEMKLPGKDFDKGMHCSEITCKAFEAGGIKLSKRQCWMTSPLDVYHSKAIDIIYKGEGTHDDC